MMTSAAAPAARRESVAAAGRRHAPWLTTAATAVKTGNLLGKGENWPPSTSLVGGEFTLRAYRDGRGPRSLQYSTHRSNRRGTTKWTRLRRENSSAETVLPTDAVTQDNFVRTARRLSVGTR